MSAPAELRVRLSLHRAALRRNLDLLRRFTADVGDDAARTPVLAGGSHLAWLLAHLVATRDLMLQRLGAEGVWDDATALRYGRGSDPSAADYPPLAELLALLEDQQDRLVAAFEALDEQDDEALALAAPEPARIERLEFLVWHETYHLGQAVFYRRAAGLASPIG